MIAVIQAFEAGKTIQYAYKSPLTGRSIHTWQDIYHPCWNFDEFNYRVKTEPESVYALRFADGSDKKLFLSRLEATNFKTQMAESSVVVEFKEVIDE